MGTSYDPTTYLNQQATTAPFVSREASAAERLRSSRLTGEVAASTHMDGKSVYQDFQHCFRAEYSGSLPVVKGDKRLTRLFPGELPTTRQQAKAGPPEMSAQRCAILIIEVFSRGSCGRGSFAPLIARP